MQCWAVGQRIDGTIPSISARLGNDGSQRIARFDGTNFDGPFGRGDGPERFRQFVGDRKRHLPFGQERFRRWNFGHFVLMLETAFVDLKRSRKAENGYAFLHRDDPARRKTFPVTQSVDLINNGPAHVSGAKEISVQRMDGAILGCRLRGRRKRLTEDLAAENRTPTEVLAMTTEKVTIEAFQCEKGDEIREDSLHSYCEIS